MGGGMGGGGFHGGHPQIESINAKIEIRLAKR